MSRSRLTRGTSPTSPTLRSGQASRSVDGRLLVEASDPGAFDVLFLDAFSSDSVPVHLLTVEAVAADLRATRPDGVLAFHLSNRYYELEPAVVSAVESLGLTALVRHFEPSSSETGQRTAPSKWLVASRDAAFLARLAAAGWKPPTHRSAAAD